MTEQKKTQTAAEFRAEQPALAQALSMVGAGIVANVEARYPGHSGEVKKEIALTEFEQFLANLKDQAEKQLGDFPPLVDLALDTAIPFASDVIEASCSLFKAGGLFGPKQPAQPSAPPAQSAPQEGGGHGQQ